MASKAPLLTAHKLVKTFASRVLFENLSFGLNDGARVGLVGQNGAGKSTLLKILADPAEADSGSVVCQRGVKIALVSQSYRTQESNLSVESWFDQELDRLGLDPQDAGLLRRRDQVASELGLKEILKTSLRELSGGWKRRVQLALALVQDPDLLLLDEPTNHLDIESIIWLEDFLKARRTTTVVVSHDRLFLGRFADSIYELDRRHTDGVLVVDGPFSTYLERKAELLERASETEKRMANRLRREKEWLSRGPKARQTKQKARIEAAADLADETRNLKAMNASRSLDLSFNGAERAPEKLIQAETLKHPLWGSLDLVVQTRSRIGFIGRNGSGKTSLIKALLFGQDGADVAGNQLTGKIRRAPGLTFEYFEQGRETIDDLKTVAQNLTDSDSVVEAGRVVHVISYLNRFGFRSEQAGLPAGKLSGGEKARLRMAQALLKPAMLLVLDEPTNDLDFETLEVLEDGLKQFPGALIVVSHDRAFLDQVVDELYAFDLTDDQTLLRFADYWQWESAWRSRSEVLASRAQKKVSSVAVADAVDRVGTLEPVKARRLSFKEKFELEHMEEKILGLEAALKSLEEKLSSGSSSTKGDEYSEMARLQGEIDSLYARWTELESLRLESTK